MIKSSFIAVVFVFIARTAYPQCSTHPVTLTQQSDVTFPLPAECMSAVHDQNGRNFLYVAAKERGLLIYDVTNISAPVQVDSIPVTSLSNLEPMSVSQDGNYLYLALGNIFVNSSVPGMAIVDVNNPMVAVLKTVWSYPVQSGGAGIVKTEGNYAYLGAMRRGLMVLDITNKSSVSLLSIFKPDISYPNPSTPDSLKYNARGMAVKNSIVYLCDDAGGVRIINATNKSAPTETGHYANPAVYNKARAYNNLVLDDTLLYVAVDYCGMEILSVNNPANIKLVSWWNPWNCESPSNLWFNSAGHTNEIQYDATCKVAFISSGKSEVSVVNLANPASPELCTGYTTTGGNVGVWGLALYQSQLYACYIYVPLGIPFYSNWSGFKAIAWNSCPMAVTRDPIQDDEITIYPNPSNGKFSLKTAGKDDNITITVYDVVGTKRAEHFFRTNAAGSIYELHFDNLVAGTYFVKVNCNNTVYYKQILINSNQ